MLLTISAIGMIIPVLIIVLGLLYQHCVNTKQLKHTLKLLVAMSVLTIIEFVIVFGTLIFVYK